MSVLIAALADSTGPDASPLLEAAADVDLPRVAKNFDAHWSRQPLAAQVTAQL